MKRVVIALCVVGLTATAAFAEWLVDFKKMYAENGIEAAVQQAMVDGIGPSPIVENSMQLDGVNPQNVVKALFCGGAAGADIRAAAADYGISEMVVAAGFKKAVEECSDKVADTQAYTPAAAAAGPAFGGRGNSGGGGNSYASPNQFRYRGGQ